MNRTDEEEVRIDGERLITGVQREGGREIERERNRDRERHIPCT